MNAFERWSIRLTSLALAVSGLGFMWGRYLVVSDDPFAIINHPAQTWFLKVHVVAAPLFMFAFGAIAVRHVWVHIRGRGRLARRSGYLTVGSAAPAIVTGYVIQIATAAWLVRWLEVSHEVAGVALIAGLSAHLVVIRRWAAPTRRPDGGADPHPDAA